LEALDDVMVVAHDVVRHPGGARPVVSGDAVFERNNILMHLFNLPANKISLTTEG
jgi:hypothetical protein